MASQASKDIVLTGRWVGGWVGVHITTLAVGGTLNPKTNKAPQVIVNLIFQKHAYVIYRFFRVTKIENCQLEFFLSYYFYSQHILWALKNILAKKVPKYTHNSCSSENKENIKTFQLSFSF